MFTMFKLDLHVCLSFFSELMNLSKITGWISPERRDIFTFSDGNMDDLNILGYKGAMLCELKLIKVPVPEGFIISCDACTDYLVGFGCFEQPGSAVLAPQLSPHLCSEISQHIHQLEKVTGSFFGIANVGQNVALPTINTPLLISIRVSTNIAVEGEICFDQFD